ncbi:MAG TPA: prepilin-type N-terminal cleavage/methylation domain-containing protein [Vicinamibacterales bacterium]|jgi:general secretion pathway protein G
MKHRWSIARARQQSGFTLIELMVVMIIIVILAGVGVSLYGNSVKNARDTTLKADLTEMRKAIDAFYADKQKYPSALDDLVSEKYLKAIPVDPITNAKDWQTTMSDRDPANPSAEPGIAEVKSNASGTSTDGTPYSEL